MQQPPHFNKTNNYKWHKNEKYQPKKSHHPLNTRALLHYVGSIIWHANSSLVTPSQICLKSLYNCALTFLWSNFFGFNMAFWHIAAEIKIKRLSMAEFHWARWALCCTSWSADCFSRTHPKDAHMRVQISRSLTAKCLLKKLMVWCTNHTSLCPCSGSSLT